MAYATVGDVQALNTARTIGVGQNPSASQVGIYLDLAAGDIDAVLLMKGYGAPANTASSPVAAEYLRSLNARGALALMEEAAPMPHNLQQAQQAWQSSLQALEKMKQVLDLAKDEAIAGPRGPGLTVPQQTIYTDCNRAYFRRHQRF